MAGMKTKTHTTEINGLTLNTKQGDFTISIPEKPKKADKKPKKPVKKK